MHHAIVEAEYGDGFKTIPVASAQSHSELRRQQHPGRMNSSVKAAVRQLEPHQRTQFCSSLETPSVVASEKDRIRNYAMRLLHRRQSRHSIPVETTLGHFVSHRLRQTPHRGYFRLRESASLTAITECCRDGSQLDPKKEDKPLVVLTTEFKKYLRENHLSPVPVYGDIHHLPVDLLRRLQKDVAALRPLSHKRHERVELEA